MSNDPAPRHAVDLDSTAVFAALDKVVAETPLATVGSAEARAAVPNTEPAPAPPPKDIEVRVPKPILRVVGANVALDQFAVEPQSTTPAAALPPPTVPASAPEKPDAFWSWTEAAAAPVATDTLVADREPPTRIWRQPGIILIAFWVITVIAGIEFFLLVAGVRGKQPISAVPTVGTVFVESTPSGAAIWVNGQDRGTTPATLTLAPGKYVMALDSGSAIQDVPLVVRLGSSTEHVFFGDVEPAALTKAPVDARPSAVESKAPPVAPGAVGGWVSVVAPIDVQLFEGDAYIGSNVSERIMLPVGRHVLTAANTNLGYKASRAVQIAAGSVAQVRLEMPVGALNINAVPWADVSIDGKAVGVTPLGNVSIPIGPHEVVFTHPQLGERRQTILVTLNSPNRVSVNFNQR